MGQFVRTSQFDFGAVSSVKVAQGGSVAIQFDDPNFVRAKFIYIDKESGLLEAVLHEGLHQIGKVSAGDVMNTLLKQTKISLSAIRPDGSVLEMNADVLVH